MSRNLALNLYQGMEPLSFAKPDHDNLLSCTSAGLVCGCFPRKGDVFAYVGLIRKLEDPNDLKGLGEEAAGREEAAAERDDLGDAGHGHEGAVDLEEVCERSGFRVENMQVEAWV